MTAEEYIVNNLWEIFGKYGDTSQSGEIAQAMKEYAELKCKELLEIVAEKAKIKKEYSRDSNLKSNYGDPETTIILIDKSSILNVVDLKEFIK